MSKVRGQGVRLLAILSITVGSAVRAEPVAPQPASGFSPAQQQALNEILKNLETLRADEKSLPAIQAYLDHQKLDLTTQLQQADTQVQQLKSQLQALSEKRGQLASRLQSIQIGKGLLASTASSPTSAPAAVSPSAPPVPTLAASVAKPEVALFVEQIKPVLTSQCLSCHGGERKKGGLDLSTHDSLVKGGDTGPAIVPGNARESLLYKLITHSQDPHMPAKAPKLPDETIARIAKWIDAGAPYDAPLTAGKQAAIAASQPAAVQASQHWAFKPVVRHNEPAVKQKSWVRNPIDSFVLAKLEAAGIQPSPEADRRTLVRRLSLDLLGLPPKPSDVDEFIHDTRPDAYERLVDRMLASPHYGERWGRHWLDLARYADSDGYEKDPVRPFAWRWRDWVIDAINRDMPFDQFTVEQLAGDLLPNSTLEQRVATGFHRNTLTNTEGGVDVEEYRVKAIKDRVSTTGTVWLGLTIGCAECHSHKYDPISQREFYQFMAFFNTGLEVNQPAPLPKDVDTYNKAKAVFDADHAKVVASVAAYEKGELPARQAEWEKKISIGEEPKWTVIKPLIASSSKGATLAIRDDGSVLASDKNPDKDTHVLVLRTDLIGITAIRIEALADPSLPNKGPGRSGNGNFVLSEVRLTQTASADAAMQSPPELVRLMRAEADHEQTDGPYRAANSIDGKAATGWAILPQPGVDHALYLAPAEPIGKPGGTLLAFALDYSFGSQHAIGKLRISVTTAPPPVQFKSTPPNIKNITKLPLDTRTPEQKTAIAQYWRKLDDRLAALNSAVEAHAKKEPPVAQAQMLIENPKPPVTHILIKGDFLRPGDPVEPMGLSVLNPFKPRAAKADRLDLARWIIDPANPMTSRVAVNRFWQYLFGQPLVATPNDFGTRSELPSHPELLDWLASEFLARGWSQKAMIKLIVTSATYRQSSHVRPELIEKDPKNILLARQSRYRVEAEVVRDVSFAVCGLLNETVGGPSIYPPLPLDVTKLAIYGISWPESKGADRYRRGMYIFFQRAVPFPMLMTFDAPDSNVSCSRRERSNTPLQSLALLNDSEFFQCAQSLGLQALKTTSTLVQVGGLDAAARVRLVAGGSLKTVAGPAGGATTQPAALSVSDAQLEPGIRELYRICLAREPDAIELGRLAQLWHEINELSARDAKSTSQMVGQPPVKLTGADLPQAAAWIAVARAVMNLDEFVTRE